MPTISLDAPVAIIAAAGKFLLAITTTGAFHTWYAVDWFPMGPPALSSFLLLLLFSRNVQTKSTASGPASIASQVTGATGGITQAKVYENGSCLITFTSGTSISWDYALGAWVRLAELWWHQAPPPPPSAPSHPHRSPISSSHRSSSSSSSAVVAAAAAAMAVAEPTSFSTALALGSLETRLHASKLLGSAGDYRAALLVYAAKLADDGLTDRADELVRELCGPVFW